MSKMTVVHENDVANYEYTYLKWPEFLEFIGRLAQKKYSKTAQDTQWPLAKKIQVILHYLFKLIGTKRLDPPEIREIVSESDDEYWSLSSNYTKVGIISNLPSFFQNYLNQTIIYYHSKTFHGVLGFWGFGVLGLGFSV